MATYVNNLRLTELATGEGSGTWGTTTNTNLELIGEALGYGSEAIANASTHTITVADGTADSARSFYLKLTGGGQACTVTLAPNTLSKVWMVENTTNSTLTFSQGSGANVAVPAGQVKMIATDGAGSGAVVYDLLVDTDLTGTTTVVNLTSSGTIDAATVEFNSLSGTGSVAITDILDQDNMSSDSATALATQQSIKAYVDSSVASFDTLAEVLAQGNTTGSNDIDVDAAQKVQFRDSAIYINSSTDGQLDIVADTEIQMAATTIDANGNLDVSGTITAGGVVTANAGVVVDNITIDGTEIDSSSSLILDIAGNLTINVDGSTVSLNDDAINFGQFYQNSSGNFNIYSPTSNKDILFLGNDGGSTVTMMTLDASEAGAATFNSTIALGDSKQIFFGAGSDGRISFDGTDTLNITASHGSATTVNVTANNFKIGGAGRLISGTVNDSVVINEDSGNVSFRVESNNNANMLFVDAGNDAAFFGGSDKRGFVNIETTPVNYSSGVFNAPHLALQASSQPDDNDGFVGITFATSDSDNYGWSAGAERTSSGVGDFVFTEHNNSATGSEKLRITQAGAATFSSTIAATGATLSGVLELDASGNFPTNGIGLHTNNFVYLKGGSNGLIASSQSGGENFRLNANGIVFNEDSGDLDFRVESNDNVNMLFVDGGNNHVGIGTATLNRSGLGTDHICLTVGADNQMGMLELQGTRTSNADLGRVSFLNAGTRRAEIVAARIDADNSTKLYFQTSNAGTLGTRLTIGKDGTATFSSTVSVAGVGVIGATDGDLNIYSTAASHGGLRLGNGYVAPTNNAGTITNDAISLGLSGQRFTNLYLSDSIQNSGKAGSATVFNEDGTTADFRVESDSQNHMFFINGGTNKIAIGHAVPDTELHVIANGNDAQMPFIIGNENITSSSTSQSVAMGFGLARDSGTVKNNAGLIKVGKTAAWTSDDSQVDSYMGFNIYKDNVSTEHMKIEPTQIRIGNTADHVMIDIAASNAAIKLVDNSQSNPPTIRGNGPNFLIENGGVERVAIDGSGNIVVNETGADADFRVESDTDANALVVDGADGTTTVRKLNLGVGGGLMGEGAISVGTSATNITSANDMGSLVIVAGNSSGAIFSDLVFFATTMGATVVTGGTVSGGPASRTYSVVASKLKLAMASGTYSVKATVFHGTL